jgi:hypothetical protein
MPRTTSTLVREICKVKPGRDLAPFIRAASQLVDDLLLEAGYTDQKLTDIETWLAAHFYHALDRRRLTQVVTSAQEIFSTKVDLRLNLTEYGQAAIVMDTSGNLAAWQNAAGTITKKRAYFRYIGGSSD